MYLHTRTPQLESFQKRAQVEVKMVNHLLKEYEGNILDIHKKHMKCLKAFTEREKELKNSLSNLTDIFNNCKRCKVYYVYHLWYEQLSSELATNKTMSIYKSNGFNAEVKIQNTLRRKAVTYRKFLTEEIMLWLENLKEHPNKDSIELREVMMEQARREAFQQL